MPLLADAYSDARLNLDTLDRDITVAIRKVERAAERFERLLTIDVELDTGRAEAALTTLETQVRRTRSAIENGTAEFAIDANTIGLLDDLAAIEGLKQDISSDIVIAVRLDTDSLATEAAAIQTVKDRLADDISVTQRVTRRARPEPPASVIPETQIPPVSTGALGATSDELDDLGRPRSVNFSIDDLVTLLVNLNLANTEIDRLQRELDLNVVFDGTGIDQLSAEMAGLQAQKANLERTLSFAADADIAAALAQLGILNEAKDQVDDPIEIPVDIDSALGNVRASLQRFRKVTASIELDTNTERVQATIASLTAEIRLQLATIGKIEPEIDDIGVLADAIKLKAELEAILRKIEVKVDLDRSVGSRVSPFLRGFQSITSAGVQGSVKGFAQAFQALQEGLQGLGTGFRTVFQGLSGSVSDAAGQISEGVGQIAGSFQKLSQAAGPVVQVLVTLGSFGLIAGVIGLVVNAIAALISVIIGLIAYVIPLATGLLAAAAGFAAVTLAATGAVAALGLLVFTSEKTQEQIKSLFESFKRVVEPALAPITDFLLNEFGPALLGSLTVVVQRLAPFFRDAFGPVLNALLPFLDILGQIGGPVAVAVGAGLAQLANTLNQFFTVLTTNEAALFTLFEGIQSLFNVLDALIRLLGEAGFAFAPFLNDILNGFASLTENSIAPFLEIIRNFGNALPALGESFGNILRPVGDLAVVIGRATEAFAPFLDEFFQFIQAVIPGLNFDAITLAIEKLTPAFAALFDRIGPLLDEATTDFVQIVDEILLGPQALSTLTGAFETFLGIIVAVQNFVLDNARSFEILLSAIIGSVQAFALFTGALLIVNSLITGAFNGIFAAFGVVVDTVVSTIADLIDAIPGAGRILNIDTDFLRTVSGGLRDVKTGMFNLSVSSGELGVSLIEASASGLQLGDSLTSTGQAADDGKDSLDKYKVTVETVAGAITLVGPAAKIAEQNLKRLNKQFPATISLLDKAADGLKAGNIFKKAVEDQKKANDQQREATEEAARLAQESVRQTFAGGRLSEFFQEQADEVNNGVKSVGEAAREAARESLGLGRLSQFIRNEAVELDRAFSEFSQNLQLRAQNLRRIARIQGAGFGDLAVQLATLADNPEFLSRFLDELEGRGTAALAQFNEAIGADLQVLRGTVAGLDPAIAEAAGFGAAPESEKAIQKQGVTVFQALDRLNNDLRLRIQNAQRLGQLQQAGFSPLAIQLSSLAGDPKELDESLNELFAAGSGAIASANARFAAANAELAATAAQLDPLLAESLGLEQTKAQVEEDKFDIFGALDTFQKEQQLRLENIRRITQLEAISPEVARGLVDAFGDDQEQLDQVLDSYFAAPVEKQGLFIAAWETQSAETQAALKELDPQLAAALSAQGQLSLASTEYWRQFGVSFQQGFEAAANASSFSQTFFEKFGIGRQPEGANTAQQQVIDEANKLGDTFSSTLTEALKADLSAAGQQSAASFLQGVQLGLLGVGQEGASIIEIILFLGEQGALFGEAIANGFVPFGERAANGFYDGLSTTLQTLVGLEATTGVAISTAGSVGAAFGESLAAGLNTAAATNINLGNVFDTLRNVSFLIGVGAALAFGSGFTTGYALAAINLATRIGTSLAALNTGVLQLLAAGGTEAGRALANTMVAALNNPLTLQQLRTAVFFFVIEIQVSLQQVAPNIGRDFINGVKAGVDETAPALLTTIGNIARLIAEVMRQALDINSPSGVGMTLGNQFIAGIAAGLEQSTGQLTTVAGTVRSALVGALAQPVSIDTALAGTAAVAGVAAPAAVIGPAVAPPSDTALLQQMLVEMQAQNAELRAVAARPLIGEYNVSTTREPQSPDQLAQDAAFAKALLL